MTNSHTRGKIDYTRRLFKTLLRAIKLFIAEVPRDRALDFGGEPAFGNYAQFFPDEAISHPAKANLSMIEWIIKRYTKEGDTVLDCMAGTYSTCIVAALNNRNAIGVELKDKFYKWGLEAKRRVEQIPTFTPKGKMVVLKGDARELSKVLAENADAVVFSPPFASEQSDQKGAMAGGTPTYKKKYGYSTYYKTHNNIASLPYGGQVNAIIFSPPFSNVPFADRKFVLKEDGIKKHYTCGGPSGYAEFGPGDIGSLPYGTLPDGGQIWADAVVFSPPYAGAKPFVDRKVMERIARDPTSKRYGRKSFSGYGEKWSKENLSNLPYGNRLADSKINDSDPQRMSYRQAGAEDARNIGNLPEIDAVIFSPLFAEAIRGGGIAQKGYDKSGKHKDIHLSLDRPLSDSPDNISNIPYGKIDAIVTSPPYSEQVSTGGDPERRAERMRAAGLDPKTIVGGRARCGEIDWQYSKNKDNIGNLPHGQIDAVITSPPYDEGLGHKVGKQKVTKTGIVRPEYTTEYQDKRQIGNLKADTYLGAMFKVYSECFKVLKPGGVMVLITKNFIRGKRVVRLDLDTIKLCEAAGFTFVERWYRKLEQLSFWRIIYAKKFNYCPRCVGVYRVRKATTDEPTLIKCPKCDVRLLPALIRYEDILVFRKSRAMCPTCGKHELVPHPSDTLLYPECGFVKVGFASPLEPACDFDSFARSCPDRAEACSPPACMLHDSSVGECCETLCSRWEKLQLRGVDHGG